MNLKRLLPLAFSLLAAGGSLAYAQTPVTGTCQFGTYPQCSDSQVTSTSGTALTIPSNGGLVPTFEYLITGTPATISITIQGCGAGGTCTTLGTAYTTVANAMVTPALSSTYDHFIVTPSWTGGTAPTVTVKTKITTALDVQGGGGLPAGCTSSGPGNITCTGTVMASNISSTMVYPEQFGALGNGGTYFDGVMGATQVWQSSNGTSVTPSAPGVTTLTNNDLVLNIWQLGSGAFTSTPATGTQRVNLVYSSGNYGLTMNDQLKATAGTVAASTGTANSTRWQGLTIPLKCVPTCVFVAQAGTQVASGVGMTLTINVPAGTANGNTMVGCISYYSNTSVNLINFPVGWKIIANVQNSATEFLACAIKVAASEPSSYTWTEPNSYGTAGFIATYSGVGDPDGSTNVLTSATAAFPANVTGDPICVAAFNYSSTLLTNYPAQQFCGTVTGYNSATSVNLSFAASSPMTSSQFAYGTSDQTAFANMFASTACSSKSGCWIHLSQKRYVVTSSIALPINVPITVQGEGMSVPNTSGSINDGAAVPNANNGTALMFLTQSLTHPAITAGGVTNHTSLVSYDNLSDFAILGGTGYAGDGGGNSIDGLDVLDWEFFDATRVAVLGFSGAGVHVDGLGSGGADFIEQADFHNMYLAFNGGAGLQIGTTGVATSQIENTILENSLVEGNWGPSVWIAWYGLHGMSLKNNTIQWGNRRTPNPEVTTTGEVIGCDIRGNYMEADGGLASQSSGFFNSVATPGNIGLIGCDINIDDNYLYSTGAYGPVIFSAAATPLTACSTGAQLYHKTACVSDATLCTNGTTYTSGGSTTCKLQCNGTTWKETGTSVGCN